MVVNYDFILGGQQGMPQTTAAVPQPAGGVNYDFILGTQPQQEAPGPETIAAGQSRFLSPTNLAAGLLGEGTTPSRAMSLPMHGLINTLPVVNAMANQDPEFKAFHGRNFGEKLGEAAGGAAGFIPQVLAGEEVVGAITPGLKGAGWLGARAKDALVGAGTMGAQGIGYGPGEALNQAWKGAYQFPLIGATAGLGGKALGALVPISEVSTKVMDPVTGVISQEGKLFGFSATLGVKTANMLKDIVTRIGNAGTGATTMGLMSGGDPAQMAIGAAFGAVGSEGAKQTREELSGPLALTPQTGKYEAEKATGAVTQGGTGTTVDATSSEYKAKEQGAPSSEATSFQQVSAPQSKPNIYDTQTVQRLSDMEKSLQRIAITDPAAVGRVSTREEQIYADRMADIRSAKTGLMWNTGLALYGISPKELAAFPELQTAHDFFQSAIDAEHAGDTGAAASFYDKAGQVLVDVAKRANTSMMSQVNPYMKPYSKGISWKSTLPKDPVETLMKSKFGVDRVIRQANGDKPPTWQERNNFEYAMQEQQKYINTPKEVVRSQARRAALQEELIRSAEILKNAPQVDVAIGQATQDGTVLKNIIKNVTPEQVVGWQKLAQAIVSSANRLPQFARSALDFLRLAEHVDRALGPNMRGQGPASQLALQSIDAVNRASEDSRSYLKPYYDKFKELGLKTAWFKGGSFAHDDLQGFLLHYLNAQTDAVLMDKRFTPDQIKAIRDKWNGGTLAEGDKVRYDAMIPVYEEMTRKFFDVEKAALKATGRGGLNMEKSFLTFAEDYSGFSHIQGMDKSHMMNMVNQYAESSQMSWNHQGSKYGVPQNLRDPITGFERLVRRTYAMKYSDPVLAQANLMSHLLRGGVEIPGPDGKSVVRQSPDVASVFENFADMVKGSYTSSPFDDLFNRNSKMGAVLNMMTRNWATQVILGFSPALKQIDNFGYAAGLEQAGPFNVARHLAAVSLPQFFGHMARLTSDLGGYRFAGENSRTFQSRLKTEEGMFEGRNNMTQNFFNKMWLWSDLGTIATTFNMSYENYMTKFRPEGMTDTQAHQAAIDYADIQAGRVSAVFQRQIKPMMFNNKLGSALFPFKTSALSGTNTLFNDIIFNKGISNFEKAGRLGSFAGTFFLAQMVQSFFKGQGGPPWEQLETFGTALIPGVGEYQRVLGAGVPGMLGGVAKFAEKLGTHPVSASLEAAATYSGIPGTLLAYKTFQNLKSVLDNGQLKDKNDQVIYQYNAGDPSEVMRALMFGPYGTWGVSDQVEAKHPGILHETYKRIMGQSEQ